MDEKIKLPKNLLLLNGFMQAGLVIWVLSHWGNINGKIPFHFDFNGNPDAWAGKLNLLIFLAVGVGINLLLFGIIAGMPRLTQNPWFMNIPGKRLVLSLPREQQIPFWNRVNELVAILGIFVNGIWTALTVSMVKFANGELERLPTSLIWLLTGGLAITAIYYSISLYSLARHLRQTTTIQ